MDSRGKPFECDFNTRSVRFAPKRNMATVLVR
jgi:hypothetical protein